MSADIPPPPHFRAKVGTLDLLRAMNRVVPVIERRSTHPVLGCIELCFHDGRLRVRGTDCDIEISVAIDAEGEGAVCVPAFRLHELLKAVAHTESVAFMTDPDGRVTIEGDTVTATMTGMPLVDMPQWQTGPQAWSVNLADKVFDFVVGGVAHAISTEETRYYLNGVCLEVLEGKLLAVATDGHRLAKRETSLPARIGDQAGIIIPRKAVRLALAMVGEAETTLSVQLSRDKEAPAYCLITSGGVSLRSKLIDGKFPDWRRVVPAASNNVIEVEAKVLRRALKATQATGERYRGRATRFDPAAGGVSMSSYDPDRGTTKVAVACPVTGQVPTFGVNSGYLDKIAETLVRAGSRTVRLHIVDPGSPVRIAPEEAIPGVLNVLMPMRM